MKTYIINLKASLHRKEHMENVLKPYGFLDIQFVEAIDGRALSDKQIDNLFDCKLVEYRYGRQLKSGEYGCTLSHRRCMEYLLRSKDDYALILEDDVIITGDFVEAYRNIERFLKHQEYPAVVLLSGDYWYCKKKKIYSGFVLADVYDAVCSQAYFINKKAASIILASLPSYVADDWEVFLSKGINVKAVFPHVVDQDRKEFLTEISPDYEGVNRGNMDLSVKLHSYIRAIIKRFLVYINHFESKSFRW